MRDATLELLTDAGEILVGQHTPFSAANFVIGCPASLPTSGFAHVSSGITAEAFLKRTAVARADACRAASGWRRRSSPSPITRASPPTRTPSAAGSTERRGSSTSARRRDRVDGVRPSERPPARHPRETSSRPSRAGVEKLNGGRSIAWLEPALLRASSPTARAPSHPTASDAPVNAMVRNATRRAAIRVTT